MWAAAGCLCEARRTTSADTNEIAMGCFDFPLMTPLVARAVSTWYTRSTVKSETR